VERVPEAGSSTEAAIMLEEVADADVAPAPPDVPAVLALVATEAAAVPVGERPVAADAEMAEASTLGASEEGGVETRSVPPSGSRRVDHFSWWVTSEVSVTQRRRSPSAQSALPLTCTRVRSLGSCFRHSRGNTKAFSIENFDAEGFPPF
jgi:hypothetical protein